MARSLSESAQAGFTLIELLVVMAILSILCGLGLSAAHVHRMRSYAAVVQSSSRNAWTALEAGAMDLDSAPMAMYGGWSNAAGEVIAWDGTDFMPGYKNPEGVQISAFYNGWCVGGNALWCVQRNVTLQHCKSGQIVHWMRWGNGIEMRNEFKVMPWC